MISVAVPEIGVDEHGGCCEHGYLKAVNRGRTAAYAAASKCTANPRPLCPQFFVNDTRVAQCDTGTSQCKMFAVDEIQCGGFINNAHHCPTGYECSHLGVNPDGGGKCVTDNSGSGAGEGEQCGNGVFGTPKIDCATGLVCKFAKGTAAAGPLGASSGNTGTCAKE